MVFRYYRFKYVGTSLQTNFLIPMINTSDGHMQFKINIPVVKKDCLGKLLKNPQHMQNEKFELKLRRSKL